VPFDNDRESREEDGAARSSHEGVDVHLSALCSGLTDPLMFPSAPAM